jgi:hypothetical protein
MNIRTHYAGTEAFEYGFESVTLIKAYGSPVAAAAGQLNALNSL